MKRIKYLIVLLLCFVFLPTVYAKDSVSIKSITLTEKSIDTVEVSKPTFNGLEMNYNLSFKEVNDYAKYNIVIENDTEKEYKVTESTSFKVSDYVTYNYTSDQIIKAKGESTISIIIKYTKEVEETKITSEGKYVETNKAVLQMVDENNEELKNPKTGVFDFITLFTLLLAVSALVFLLIQKKQMMFAIIIAICLVPALVYAVEELKLTINVNVEIEKEPVVQTNTEQENTVPTTPKPEPTKYEVMYLYDNIELYLKDSEMEKYDLTNADCEVVLYVGSVSPENKYTYCDGDILFKEGKYQAGSRVELKDNIFRNIQFNEIPVQQSENIYFIEQATISNLTPNISHYVYDKQTNELYNNTISDNDKETMRFDGYVFDFWNEDKELGVVPPTTFIMPEHNVIFYTMNRHDNLPAQ